MTAVFLQQHSCRAPGPRKGGRSVHQKGVWCTEGPKNRIWYTTGAPGVRNGSLGTFGTPQGLV